MLYHVEVFLAFCSALHGYRRAIFSLSETLAVILLLHCFCKSTKLYIYF